MKYEAASVREELYKITDEIAKLRDAIERERYVHLPSEVEPGTIHKIKLEEREWFRRTRDLRERWRDLKRDRDALDYMLKDLLESEESKRRFSESSKAEKSGEETYDFPITDLEDFQFAIDSVAVRRRARLEKVAKRHNDSKKSQ